MQYLLMTLLFLTGVFLILLVLVQRGRGGGLAGAFGGMGGQSAFGTKAGDVFTRVTIGVAAFWIILCALSVKLLNTTASVLDPTLGSAAQRNDLPGAATGKGSDKVPANAGTASPEDKDKASEKSPEKTAPADDAAAKPPVATEQPSSTTPPAAPAAETPAADAPKPDAGK